jgi:hypothetical protein
VAAALETGSKTDSRTSANAGRLRLWRTGPLSLEGNRANRLTISAPAGGAHRGARYNLRIFLLEQIMPNNRDDLVLLNTDAVRQIMRDRGIGRNALARLMKRESQKEVGMWINGQRRPNRDNAQNMADALGCDIEHLTGEKPFRYDCDGSDPLVAANPTGSSTLTVATTGIVGIIKVDEHAASLDQKKLLELAEIIGRIVELGGEATFIGKPREGCVELTLRLTREEWSRLEIALAEGKLADAKVIKVEPFSDLEFDDDVEETHAEPAENVKTTIDTIIETYEDLPPEILLRRLAIAISKLGHERSKLAAIIRIITLRPEDEI